MTLIENTEVSSSYDTVASFASEAYPPSDDSYVSTRARIAIYDDMRSSPRVIDIGPSPTADFIENVAASTYEQARGLGGALPYTVIREIAENFIHARFKECTVSILDRGNTIRFSDQGPGIEKKGLVLQPGVTSATAYMKRFIKGVGSGFPIVQEYLQISNGYLSIDDNALDGVVVTISLKDEPPPTQAFIEQPLNTPILTAREKSVLHLFLEEGAIGPSDLTGPFNISGATAFRLLEKLEEKGLVEMTANRKRILSNAGLLALQAMDR
jgi:hypothetical protein